MHFAISRVRLPLILFGALLAGVLLWLMPASPLVTADSPGYVDFLPFRTAGYPLFLDLAGRGAVVAQILLFAVSATILALAVADFARPWVGGLVLLALFANPEVNAFHFSILTESLFLSIDCLLLAAAVAYARGNRRLWIAGALGGLAVAVRPAAAMLLCIPLVLGLVRRDWKGIGAALLAFLAIAGAERLYAYQVHGPNLSSLSARHLFAKSALIDAPAADRSGYSPLDRRLADALERDYQPVRDLIRQSSGPIRTSLIADYEVCIQWACQNPLALDRFPRPLVDASLRRVALDRIGQNPGGYLDLAGREFLGLWSIGARTHPANAPLYDRFMADAAPVPLEAEFRQTGALDPTTPRRAALIARPLFIAMGIAIALVLLVSALLWRRPLFLMAGVAALSVEASFAFVALTAVGYGRYTVALWPNLMLAFILFAVGLLSFVRPKWIAAQSPAAPHTPASAS